MATCDEMEADLQLKLRDNISSHQIDESEKHSYLAFSKMNVFRKRNQLCDVVVRVGDREFPAHRVVLAASSDYFDAMFSSGMAESAQPAVELKSISADVMEALLEFVYTGQVKVSMDNVQDLLPAASLVQMEGVKAACSAFLYGEVDPSNVLGIRRFAELHHCTDLEVFAKNFAAHNFETVIEHEEFICLAPEELIELVSREDLHIDCEEIVYKAIIRWVYFNQAERRSYLPLLLRSIRLAVMSVRFLTDFVDCEPLVKQSHECRDLVDDAKRFHLRPDLRHGMCEKRYRQRDGADEYLVVIGGFGSDQSPSDSVEMLNPRTREWTELPSLPIRYRYVAACSLGTCVYVIGGFDGRERLDTVGVLDIAQRDGWRRLASMHYKRGLSAACTHRGLIYVCGGFDGQTRLRSLEVYHSKIDEWRVLDQMHTAREGAGLVVADDCLYCLGGYDGFHLLNSMEAFNLRDGTWTMCKPMYMRRSGAGCAVLCDTIYVCGGYGGAEGRVALHLDTAEAYSTRLAQWTLIACMDVPRCYVGACSLGGRVYVAAGYNGHRLLDTVEYYDPIENQWKLDEDCRMHHERCDTGMCVVRFLPCAQTSGGPPATFAAPIASGTERRSSAYAMPTQTTPEHLSTAAVAQSASYAQFRGSGSSVSSSSATSGYPQLVLPQARRNRRIHLQPPQMIYQQPVRYVTNSQHGAPTSGSNEAVSAHPGSEPIAHAERAAPEAVPSEFMGTVHSLDLLMNRDPVVRPAAEDPSAVGPQTAVAFEADRVEETAGPVDLVEEDAEEPSEDDEDGSRYVSVVAETRAEWPGESLETESEELAVEPILDQAEASGEVTPEPLFGKIISDMLSSVTLDGADGGPTTSARSGQPVNLCSNQPDLVVSGSVMANTAGSSVEQLGAEVGIASVVEDDSGRPVPGGFNETDSLFSTIVNRGQVFGLNVVTGDDDARYARRMSGEVNEMQNMGARAAVFWQPNETGAATVLSVAAVTPNTEQEHFSHHHQTAPPLEQHIRVRNAGSGSEDGAEFVEPRSDGEGEEDEYSFAVNPEESETTPRPIAHLSPANSTPSPTEPSEPATLRPSS